MPSKKCRTRFFENTFFHCLVLQMCRKPANEQRGFQKMVCNISSSTKFCLFCSLLCTKSVILMLCDHLNARCHPQTGIITLQVKDNLCNIWVTAIYKGTLQCTGELVEVQRINVVIGNNYNILTTNFT